MKRGLLDSLTPFSRILFFILLVISTLVVAMVIAMLLFSLFDSLLILWLGKISLAVRLLTHLPLIPLVGGVAYFWWQGHGRRTTGRV